MAKINLDLKMEQYLTELSLYLRLPVVALLLHVITAVTEGGDQVSLDIQA